MDIVPDLRHVNARIAAGEEATYRQAFHRRWSSATRRAHARAMAQLDADPSTAFDMSDADLAELAAQQEENDVCRRTTQVIEGEKRLAADLAAEPYEARAEMTLVPAACDEPRIAEPFQTE